MKILLKLPKEILFMIVEYIDDMKILEELIAIPELQQLVLRKKYFRFNLESNWEQQTEDRNGGGDIAKLKFLYENYEFKPSKIRGNVTIINELINSRSYDIGVKRIKIDKVNTSKFKHLDQNYEGASYKGVDFEVFLSTSTTFEAFKEVSDKVNIVAILAASHFMSPFGLEHDQEILFLEEFRKMNLESLKMCYSNNFMVQLPVSLKQLFLVSSACDNANLSSLIHLENLKLYDCTGINSFSDLQLSKSIKLLSFEFCDIAALGDLTTYNELKIIDIFGCEELVDFIKCSLPNSMEKIVYSHDTAQWRISDLIRGVTSGENTEFDVSDFSEDGIFLGANFILPSQLKELSISSVVNKLTLGTNLELKNLNRLEVVSLQIDLIGLLFSLPSRMLKIEITSCFISKVETIALFPESVLIIFRDNTIENVFETNLNGMKRLNTLKVESVFLSLDADEEDDDADVCRLMIPNSNAGNLLELSAESRKEEILFVDLPNVTQLSLCNPEGDWYASSIPPQFSLTACGNLKNLNLRSLKFHQLNLDWFPNSLEVLNISGMKLNSIIGNFYNFNKLKELELVENEIRNSMLIYKTFPSSLQKLDLSNNEFENLKCLNLSNCVRLRFLELNEVTRSKSPLGANELKDWFLKLMTNAGDRCNRAILSNYTSEIIFVIVDGVDKTR